ncbi:MAG: LLM class flavin-dependent oxidoreductase [Alphaproteobacteria bacterium]|nr:LLM class flavin-dependent oxidoreductase [Alphaproteobacteria bacterium]
MMTRMPALSLAAVPGRRKATLELAGEIERRGFTGIYCPSTVANVTLCAALAQATNEISFGTSIAPIYARTVLDYAQTVSFIHEISGGRFRFGIGVSHGPSLKRMKVTAGKPLSDTREFVADLKAIERVGELPPIILAAMRRKMIALAGEIGDGMVFANASRSFMEASLAALPDDKRNDENFYIGNMIPTCISDDVEAAKAVNRRTLTSYAQLPNYRNYWKESGYAEEMAGVEAAMAAGEPEKVPDHLSDKWLADNTLFGTVSQVREGLEAWFDTGVRTPILVPSSANGNQIVAFEEVFAAFS